MATTQEKMIGGVKIVDPDEAAEMFDSLARRLMNMSGEEFLRRWEAMPDLKHAELIDGIVHMPSPVSFKHSILHGPLCGWAAVVTIVGMIASGYFVMMKIADIEV